MVEEWSKDDAIVTCQFLHFGVVKPETLKKLLQDPMKVFLVRFFDESSRSMETHFMWNDLVKQIKKNPLFRAVIPYQINCDAQPEFCTTMKIGEMPEMLAYRSEKVITYFTQKFDISELNEETMLAFLQDLNAINPLRKHIVSVLEITGNSKVFDWEFTRI